MTDLFASPTLLEGYTQAHAFALTMALLLLYFLLLWYMESRKK